MDNFRFDPQSYCIGKGLWGEEKGEKKRERRAKLRPPGKEKKKKVPFSPPSVFLLVVPFPIYRPELTVANAT